MSCGLLNRWDAAILGCRFVDALSDALVYGNLPVFFTEVFGVGDVTVAWAIAFFELACRAYSFSVAARAQDTWPKYGPFGATVVTKLLGVVALLAIVLPACLAGSGTEAGFFATSLTYNGVLALAETLSSAVYLNAYVRVSKGREGPVYELLSSCDYYVSNLAGLSTRLIMYGLRAVPLWGAATADILILSLGMAGFVGSAAIAHVLQHHFVEDTRMRPSPEAETPATWAETVPFFLYAAVVLGAEAGADQLGLTLPKFIIRRYGDVTAYPLYQAINPLVVLLLLPVVTYALPKGWSIPWLLVAGTGIQAAAWLGIALLADWSRYVVVVALVVYTIGELVAFPRLTAYVMREIVPKGSLGVLQSRMTLPRGLVGAGITGASGYLLETYCPSAAQCSTLQLWLPVAAVTALTPLAMPFFHIFYMKQRRV